MQLGTIMIVTRSFFRRLRILMVVRYPPRRDCAKSDFGDQAESAINAFTERARILDLQFKMGWQKSVAGGNIAQFLGDASEVEDLELCVDDPYLKRRPYYTDLPIPASLSDIIHLRRTYPKLVKLCLASIDTDQKSFRSLMSASSGTLRILILTSVSLTDGCWGSAIGKIAQFLQLQSIEISGLLSSPVGIWYVTGILSPKPSCLRTRVEQYILTGEGDCPIPVSDEVEDIEQMCEAISDCTLRYAPDMDGFIDYVASKQYDDDHPANLVTSQDANTEEEDANTEDEDYEQEPPAQDPDDQAADAHEVRGHGNEEEVRTPRLDWQLLYVSTTE